MFLKVSESKTEKSSVIMETFETSHPETMIGKTHLSAVVVGDLNAGKSTLAGRLLYKLGELTYGDVVRSQKAATKMGKESCQCAFLMDTSNDERRRGVSINISYREFSTDSYHYTMIDAPGHRYVQLVPL